MIDRRAFLASLPLLVASCYRQEAPCIETVTTLRDAERAADRFFSSNEDGIYVVSAPWCGHCRVLEHDLETLADGSQRIVVASINEPENPGDLLKYFNARAGDVFSNRMIPAAVIRKRGSHIYTQGYDSSAKDVGERRLLTDVDTREGITLRELF